MEDGILFSVSTEMNYFIVILKDGGQHSHKSICISMVKYVTLNKLSYVTF